MAGHPENFKMFSSNFYVYPLCAVIIWTGNILVSKAATAVIEPAAIAFFRWALAGLVLTPFVARAVWRQRAVVAAHWMKIAFLGLLGMALFQGLAYEAARTTSAVNMGVMVALMPLFSALLAGLFTGDKLTTAKIGGALLSLAGVLVLCTHGDIAAFFAGEVRIGDGLMLVAVASNALYGVLLKRWDLPLKTWEQLYVQIAFGVLCLLPFWLYAPPSPVNAQNIWMILYAAIPASIGAPFFWMRGIKHLGPARASLFMNLLPLFVALAAYLLLKEALHGYHALGGALALAGVWWGQRSTAAVSPSPKSSA